MKRALIESKKCLNCKICTALESCPRFAIFRECDDEKPWVDFYKCTGCMKCKNQCKGNAIEFITQPCSMTGRTNW